ncbi:MAG: hypothetical protein QOF78_919, partial [Phycisphaerales bacterium]|nr:hypothetical protein [Phycisphaerales bacterium]
DEFWDGDGHKWVFFDGARQGAANGAIMLPDGSLLITGSTFIIDAERRSIDNELLLVKIDPNGFGPATDEEDFGVMSSPVAGSRVARTPLTGMAGLAPNAAIDSAGRIVVSGMHEVKGILVRYTADGMLDASFGNGGIVHTNYLDTGSHSVIALDANDNILATFGYSVTGHTKLARFLADGAVDRSFGSNGALPAIASTSNFVIRVFTMDAHGNIIALVNADSTVGRANVFLARLLAPAPVEMPAPPVEDVSTSMAVRPTGSTTDVDWSLQPIALPDSLLEPKEDDARLADWLAA